MKTLAYYNRISWSVKKALNQHFDLYEKKYRKYLISRLIELIRYGCNKKLKTKRLM